MPSTSTDRLNGLSTSVAVKAPVKAVAIAPITLSGEQTVNGTAVVDGDRVLVTAQASSVDNGIYDVSTGDWTRSADFDGARDVVKGTLVVANNGSSIYYRVNSIDPITPGTSAITFDAITDLVEAQFTNVLDYGADPTGVASSTTAFKDAFEVGGEVIIPPGTYTLATMIDATISNLTVRAAGATINCTLTDDGTYKSAVKLTGTAASRIALHDFDLTYTGTASGESLYGITIPTLVESVYCESVKVSGFRYYAGSMNASVQTHVNCMYDDNYHAGLAPYGGTFVIEGGSYSGNGNGVNNTTGYGIVASGTDGRIKGIRAVSNGRYGIDGRRAGNIVVESNYVFDSGLVGIYLVNEDADKDAANIKVLNNTVDMNNRASSDWAIWVGGYGTARTASPGEIDVSHNTVKNGLGVGILVGIGDAQTGADYPVSTVTVNDNAITNMVGNGISIAGTGVSPDSIVVHGNHLKEANEIQVAVVGGVASITDNIFTYAGAETRLIYCTATTSIITGNIVNGANTDNGAIEVTSTSYHIAGNILGSFCRGSATFDPGSLADGAGETTTVTCAGAALGDLAFASFSLDLAGVLLTAWVSSANTVSVRFQNETGAGPVDLLSGTLRVRVSKVK